ncbi:OprD family outer membrane porin [Apibacter raozihei]|uniref:OprD family outer membrane porin n=1 Tax=Apibacter raozihei TaxID=2500547 RepID=UPI000FE43423|nr:OprD family outer membrane porin [Apibacter raozihei]
MRYIYSLSLILLSPIFLSGSICAISDYYNSDFKARINLNSVNYIFYSIEQNIKIDTDSTKLKERLNTPPDSLLQNEIYAADDLTTQNSKKGFLKKSSLGGTLYFWDRNRERKNVITKDYVNDIIQTTFTAELNFKSAPIAKMFSVELGGYGVWQPHSGGTTLPSEIAFSNHKSRWRETWDEDSDGVSFYKALIDFRLKNYLWAKVGYIQPSGQTLLAPHWSLLPGTYEGFEVGTVLDFGKSGVLSASYMWTDRYKTPWYRKLDKFYRMGPDSERVNYLHSLGAKYDFKNNLVLEAAFGQSAHYLNQYLGKISYKTNIANNPLSMSYQFYGSQDQDHSGTKVYDGLAWLQGITLFYQTGPVGWKLEGTAVQAKGEQGFFLQRMTSAYASTQGRLDIWWNSRSDFDAHDEKAIFGEISYDLKNLFSFLEGFKIAASYAYGWDARPSKNPIYDQTQKIWERAWNLDLGYVIPKGSFKGTLFQIHYTNYNNNSKNAPWSGGYGNIFQDEHDLKIFVILPFTVLSPQK